VGGIKRQNSATEIISFAEDTAKKWLNILKQKQRRHGINKQALA